MSLTTGILIAVGVVAVLFGLEGSGFRFLMPPSDARVLKECSDDFGLAWPDGI